MREWKEVLKGLIEISEVIEERLRELEKLEAIISYLEGFVDCTYSEECYISDRNYVKRLRDWLRLYEKVSNSEPEKLLDEIPYGFMVKIEYSKMRLVEICYKDSWSDCVKLDVKLPLDEDAKKSIVEAVQHKIKRLVEEMPEEYIKTVLTVTEILAGMKDRINSLSRQYRDLSNMIESIAKKLVLG